MLIYIVKGSRNFEREPAPVKARKLWEFWASLSGNVDMDVGAEAPAAAFTEPTLLALPPNLKYGWRGRGSTDRVVFGFSIVPAELTALLPARGYYRVPLTRRECERVREMIGTAELTISRPTQLSSLQQQAIGVELSLMALRDAQEKPLTGTQMAQTKTQQALEQYASGLSDGLKLKEIGKRINVSRAHLRRLFQATLGESPKSAFNRIRMQRVDELLAASGRTLEDIAVEVGFSGPSALTRAVRKHFGMTPGRLRKLRKNSASSLNRELTGPSSQRVRR